MCATFFLIARARKIPGDDRRDYNFAGRDSVERLRSQMAGTLTGRHSDRTRAFGVLFPNRHLHHHQYRAESALLHLSTLMPASAKQLALDRHVARLVRCRRCPRMKSMPVSGGAVISEVMLIGHALGPREPTLNRPLSHMAGLTLLRWLLTYCII